jgi:hypothetical protein
MARIGSVAAAPFVGDTFASLYLGDERVPTVPGKPTIDVVASEGGEIGLFFFPPENDGGSAITGYKFYFDDVEVTPYDSSPTSGGRLVAFFFGPSGPSAQVSAVNAVGEGPRSAPVTVT